MFTNSKQTHAGPGVWFESNRTEPYLLRADTRGLLHQFLFLRFPLLLFRYWLPIIHGEKPLPFL